MELFFDYILNQRFSPETIHGESEKTRFQEMVLRYYREEKRPFPWRETQEPYRILVSEIMLQQTQAPRVVEKYQAFVSELKDFEDLARVSTQRLLELWQGLGYNRRALALREAAIRVVEEYNGLLPNDPEQLVQFKGIGPNTAASICAFAFNRPVVFIETNIRRAFIYYFFRSIEEVDDRLILPLVESTLYRDSPRDWYNALMDLGTVLKSYTPNPNRRSKQYKRQSSFEGSFRQIRGAILKTLGKGKASLPELKEKNEVLKERDPKLILKAAEELINEGFVAETAGIYQIRD